MKELPRIFGAYTNVDGYIEAQRSSCASDADARQILNDQADFLLCWGQIEVEIDERCRQAVRSRRSHPDWPVRRAWDLYNPDVPRFSGLSFENRVTLVLDARGGRGSPFALAIKHYGVRNQIAHGKLQATRINLGAFVADCYLIQAALHRAT